MSIALEILEMLDYSKKQNNKILWKEKLVSAGFINLDFEIEEDADSTIISLSNDKNLIFGFTSEDGFYAVIDEDTILELGKSKPDMYDLGWLDNSLIEYLIDPTDEKFKVVVRDGQKIKKNVPTVKKRLSSKQKAAFKKAGAKRKGKKIKPAELKKRAKSLKIRKRLGI